MKNKLLAAAILTATIAIAASLFVGAHLSATLLRWLAILLVAAYATSRRSLTTWIFVGLLAGAEFGHDWPAVAVNLQLLGTIFLRLIKVIIAPLLFGVLVVGIAGHSDLKKVGRLGIKSLIYFEVVSTLAMLIGYAAIHISRAGEGVHLPPSSATQSLNVAPHTATQLITDIFPENIAKSVAEGQVLQIVVFSVLFAMGLALVPEAKRRPMLAFAESLSETMFKFTNLVMYAAPIGVFGAVAYTVGHLGLGVLLPLVKLLATMYVALTFFTVCVLLPIALWARIPIKRFINAAAGPVTLGFATASSEATLPSAMEQLESFGYGRREPLSIAGIIFCGAGRWTAPQHRPTNFDDFDADDQQQRNRRRGARFAADCFRRGNFVSPSDGTVISSVRDRSVDGHGAHGSHRSGELRGVRRDRAMGRRISR